MKKDSYFQIKILLKDLTSTIFLLRYGCKEKKHHKKEADKKNRS